MAIAITLHLLAATIWVGGMFFAYLCLRPAAGQLLTLEQRLPLWASVFAGFFKWVWLSVIALLGSGLFLIFAYGGMAAVGVHVHIMLLIGIFMMLIFMHVFFSPYKKLRAAVHDADWISGRNALEQIRKLVLLNLILGLITIVIGGSGRFW